MLRNYLLTAWRNSKRSKGLLTTNLIGLSLAMMLCLFIASYLDREVGFDSHHQNGDQIYRVVSDSYLNGEVENRGPFISSGLPAAMKERLPEVLEMARIQNLNKPYFKIGNGVFEETFCSCEKTILDVLTFEILSGTASGLEDSPNFVLVSESFAKKHFDGDAIGKEFRSLAEVTYYINGVFRDIPSNSHLQFDVLSAFSQNARRDQMDSGMGLKAYFLLREDSDITKIEEEMYKLLVDAGYGDYKKGTGPKPWLQPIEDVHLNSSDFRFIDEEQAGDKTLFFILLISMVLLIFISWFNYINLSLSNALKRNKEIGVRKVMGASRPQLIKQFIVESLMVTVMSAVLAISGVQLLEPVYTDLVGVEPQFGLHLKSVLTMKWPSLTLLGLVLACPILAGIYVAFALATSKPSRLFNGTMVLSTNAGGSQFMRRLLVVFQFFIAIAASIVLYGINQQLLYFQNKSVGFNPEHTTVIDSRSFIYSQDPVDASLFKNELEQLPFVKEIAFSAQTPGGIGYGRNTRVSSQDQEGNVISNTYSVIGVSDGFIDFYDLEILEGVNFDKIATGSRSTIINESALRAMGYETAQEAIGKLDRITRKTIIAVVKDYHHESLKSGFKPIIFERTNSIHYPVFSVRTNGEIDSDQILALEKEWYTLFPNSVFRYTSLSDHLRTKYTTERNFSKIVGVLTLATIIISILGLLGITYLSIVQRTKEFGIRKVLGATFINLIKTVSKPYLVILVLSILLALPISAYFLLEWFENYPFRIPLAPSIFAVPVVGVMSLVFMILMLQSGRIVRLKIMDCLRYE